MPTIFLFNEMIILSSDFRIQAISAPPWGWLIFIMDYISFIFNHPYLHYNLSQ